MFVVVLLLMVTFGSSQRLATAYGVSVTGALLIDTLLLLSVARALFHRPTWKLVLAAVALGGTEATFLGANLTKILHGGWLPLLIAAVMFTVMGTWQRGRQVITRNRAAVEGSLGDFVEELRARPRTWSTTRSCTSTSSSSRHRPRTSRKSARPTGCALTSSATPMTASSTSHRVLLFLKSHAHRVPRTRSGALAQCPLHRPRPQRRRPLHPLRTPTGPHRRHGLPRRALTRPSWQPRLGSP